LQLPAIGIDLLHSPDHVLPHRLRTPSVLTIHDLSFWAVPETHCSKSRRYYERCRDSLRQADAIICVSEFTRDELFRLSDVDRHKVHVVSSGLAAQFSSIDASAIGRARRKYGLIGRYAIFVGTLGYRKNVVRLTEAFLNAEAATDVTLVLVGRPGNAFEDVSRIISRQGNEKRVRMLGSPPDADMPALIAGAEFLALVSLYEGFGFPVLEAMACGIACLICNTRPLVDLAGPAGYTVDPLDVDDIANGIDEMLESSSLRRRLGNAGPSRAAKYSWERTATRTCEIYEKVLN
jgi:glycosyltransferase involved in cell wall biosynthesis